jgi:hypothetical protein
MKPPLRFSLLGLFALVTIVALGVSLYLAQTRLAKAEAEVARLRQETGYLTIDDPSQVHVIAVPTGDPHAWRWRVYLPGGHDFGIFAQRGKFAPRGLLEQGVLAVQSRIGGSSDPNQPREIVVDAALGKSAEGQACLWISENGEHDSGVFFDTLLPTWADGTKMPSEKAAGKRTLITAAVDQPLGLLKLDGVGSKGETCDDAVLIWIGKYEKHPEISLRDRGILPKGR